MNLPDEQLNLAMCEWMGWTNIGRHFEPSSLVSGIPPHPHHTKHLELIPNYLSDDSPRRLLNEAEAKLTAAQSREYSGRLLIHLGFNREIPFFTKSGSATVEFELMCGALRSATARQRTIAILKTVKPEMFQQ